MSDNLAPTTKLTELELDHCFWRAVSASTDLQIWLLDRACFGGLSLRLVTSEKWHQRWYRDPDTKKDSETDILLLFESATTKERYALHIENKPDHRRWEPDQVANYRKRALNRMGPWRYVDFRTVLLCPSSFAERHSAEAAAFDFVISYEDVASFAPEFGSSPAGA